MPSTTVDQSIAALVYLMPGFLAAWVYFGLTSHPKPPQFERVIQALVLTFVIHAITPALRWSSLGLGQVVSLGPWTVGSERLAQLVAAMVIGITFAILTNSDSVHSRLRSLRLTTRTSHPSEWYAVLATHVSYTVLQLHDGRRLYGWPKEWPLTPNGGHFYIMEPSWILDDGTTIELPPLDGILIAASDVQWVEILQSREEVHA